MCKIRDAAMNMLEIALNEYNISDMNYVKLFKMLYLAQCYALAKYSEGETKPYLLFEEDVTAHQCGPYMDDLLFIPAIYGVGTIEKNDFDNPSSKRPKPEYLMISYFREKSIRFILEKYGKRSAAELVVITKNTSAYKKYPINSDGPRPTISVEDMKITGKELFPD